MKKETWVWLGLGVLAAYFVSTQTGVTSQATPLSIYPELAYTAQTSMAATPQQQAPTTTQYASTQQSAQAAILAQCAGASVCSPLLTDVQLGF